jgi:surface antigen
MATVVGSVALAFGSLMRFTSWIAALALAAAISLFWQPAANSAETGTWQTDVAADPAPDGGQPLSAKLTDDDPVALLEAMRYALDEVADGATYLWHRVDAPLKGAVRPIASFRNESGAVCRRLSVTLTFEAATRWTDAVACREDGGRWVIGG